MPSKPDEHPLMSNRTLRALYAGIASSSKVLAAHRRRRGEIPLRGALADAACLVAPVVGLAPADIAFPCRADCLLSSLRSAAMKSPAPPHISDGVSRLYAAVGAAIVTGHQPHRPAIVAFFERHETEEAAWARALGTAAELPLLLIVLPGWKGREASTDLGKYARAANVPAIPVDAQDPIALYRVAQESLIRARAGGGAALLEAVHLPGTESATVKLAAYLLHRRIVSRSWIASHNTPLCETT